MAQDNYSPRYYLYTLLMALVGSGALLFETLSSPTELALDWPSLLLFSALALASKFLSFTIMGLITLSLDSAVYVTAALCLGVLPGAWIIFLTLFAKMVWDHFYREVVRRRDFRPLPENLIAPLFQAGTGALAVLLMGRLLPVDDFAHGQIGGSTYVLWLALAFMASFLVVQYLLVLHKYFLRGQSWPTMFRTVMIPGIGSEMILAPLAMLMAEVYRAAGGLSVTMAILVVTYLFMNVVFRQLTAARGRLDEKVKHLESLNRLGRTVCSSLLAPDLIPALTQQTLTVVERAEVAMLLVHNEEHGGRDEHLSLREGKVTGDQFDRTLAGRLAERLFSGPESGSEATAEGLLRRGGGDDGLADSWAAIPVTVHEQTIGVLLVFARGAARFDSSDIELLQMIGQQAAVALENSRLYLLATVDGLTRLYLRRYFDQRLAEEFQRARRYGSNFALMVIDFDDFKGINDRFGHGGGDLVLRRAAELLRNELRTMDIPARCGGDEYAVLMPQTSLKGAFTVANRLLFRVRNEKIRCGDEWLSFSLSIGIAGYLETAASGPTELLAAADAALYQAKAGGKGRVAATEAGSLPATES